MALFAKNFNKAREIHPPERYGLSPPGIVSEPTLTLQEIELLTDKEMRSNPVVLYEHSDVRASFTSKFKNNGISGRIETIENLPLIVYGDIAPDLSDVLTVDTHLSGTTFFLGRPNSADYFYHWIIDDLPRLGYLEDSGIDLSAIDHFLVMSSSRAFHQETLEAVGIDLEKIVEVKKNTVYQFDNLLHIECGNGIGLKMNDRIVKYLNKLYPAKPSGNFSDRIHLYVSRPQDVRRHIIQEQAFLPMLEEAGFTIVQMEDLSVKEGVDLFRRADVVISPHGGALTNLVYCKPGTKVLEIFGRHVFPFYFGLSQLCGFEYTAALSEPDDLPYLINFKEARAKQASKDQTESQSIVCSPAIIEKYLSSITPI